MAEHQKGNKHRKKRVRPTDREQNTATYLLRCVQLGLSISDLELLEIGMVSDMLTEAQNDDWKGWREKATQADFDNF